MTEKKKRKALEELSAYLDGEASDPAAVRQRLEQDSDAARMAKELSALSEELGRLAAPDVHPAFRTRVMANVRETPREPAPPLVPWRWSAFAAMVVLVPFAAAIWTFWSPPPVVSDANGQRALVRYLFEQDEDTVLNELAALFVDGVDEMDSVDGVWLGVSDDPLETVQEVEWLDILAMDSGFVAWDGALNLESWNDIADSLSENEVREIRMLLMEQASGDALI